MQGVDPGVGANPEFPTRMGDNGCQTEADGRVPEQSRLVSDAVSAGGRTDTVFRRDRITRYFTTTVQVTVLVPDL